MNSLPNVYTWTEALEKLTKHDILYYLNFNNKNRNEQIKFYLQPEYSKDYYDKTLDKKRKDINFKRLSNKFDESPKQLLNFINENVNVIYNMRKLIEDEENRFYSHYGIKTELSIIENSYKYIKNNYDDFITISFQEKYLDLCDNQSSVWKKTGIKFNISFSFCE